MPTQCLLLLVLLPSLTLGADLQHVFSNPPPQARPFVRWWWNGLRVNQAEIVREIEVMQHAGLGGFEINPIAMPEEVADPEGQPVEWLSPEFCRLVRVAADEAKRRNMVCDLIVGSGWPFGGEFLGPAEMTQRVVTHRVLLDGPQRFSREVSALLAEVKTERDRGWPGAPPPALLSAHLAPATLRGVDQLQPLTPIDGVLRCDVPAGRHWLCLCAVQRGFSAVVHGAPGAKGPVLDHYNAAAVNAYLTRMSDRLAPALGGRLGPAVRAVFCDSIELSRANWTGDLPAQFAARRGYDLLPWLPVLLETRPALPLDPALGATLRRVRYDFSRTLAELFTERFTRTYHRWCRGNGVLSRFQAYGSPWLLGMLDGYRIPDIPESNNWLFSDPDRHGFPVWTKYCSSGGHLAGRRIISTEAMTNTRGVFQATLGQIKAADDLNFVMGINHSVLHGFNYSPRDAAFPGWVRYGAYFSEQNTWWRHLRRWTDYNARLSAVFQESQPVVPVAILGCEADLWSDHGLERGPFHNQPWYVHQLWRAFSSQGCGADYLSESVLQEASAADGKLRCGAMAYSALVVAGARTLQPATARALQRLAHGGVPVAYVGAVPDQAAGLRHAGEGDAAVQTAVQVTLARGVLRREAPTAADALLAWADELLTALRVPRSITWSRADARVYTLHHRDGLRDLYFLVNTDPSATVALTGSCSAPNRGCWRWDPETGRRSPFAAGCRDLAIELGPHESLLLYCDPDRSEQPKPVASPLESSAQPVEGRWRAEFVPQEGKRFKREPFALTDLGASPDAELSRFSGMVIYRLDFEVDDPERLAFLDLGRACDLAEVHLNGKGLGLRWYGRALFDTRDAAKVGANRLEVKVTTTLFNRLRAMTDNPTAQRWLRQATRKEPVPAGLIGPVRMLAAR